MNTKQRVIDKLQEKDRTAILKDMVKDFIAEDKAEPFMNRWYVDSTKDIFDMLLVGNEDNDITINGGALCDIINVLFDYYGAKR